MGLFDDLFGSHSSGQSSSTNQQTQNQTGTSQQQSTSATQQTTEQTQQQASTGQTTSASSQQQQTAGKNVVSTLDDQTQALLKGLLPQLANNAAGAGAGDTSNSDALKVIASHLFEKATGGNAAVVNQATEADKEAAKLDFETGEGQQIGLTQQAIGSTDNTYSKLIADKGRRDLATTLNQIAASGALKASELDTGDFSAAISALRQSSDTNAEDINSSIGPLLEVVNALKGATSVSDTSETTTGASQTNTQTAEQQLASVLAKINGQTGEKTDTSSQGTAVVSSKATGQQSGVASGGIIQSILGLF